jgi:MerR family transcriptional regulator, copper efflux regulator
VGARLTKGLTFNLGQSFSVQGVSTYTIGETAGRSRFTASALRYYEGIGLEPSTRTDTGYCRYDDNPLAGLAFIAGADQLGCSLEEIIDLAGIWDGERCGPVQKCFHDLVTTKLADAELQIAEFTALADQIRHAAAQLAAPAIDGPCDEGCPCLALDNDSTAPITCKIDSDDIAERIELVERMRQNLERLERGPYGLLLHLPNRPDIQGDLSRFVVDERRCCQFWRFAVDTTDGHLTLRWDAPPAANELVAKIEAYFDGDEPLTSIRRLL